MHTVRTAMVVVPMNVRSRLSAVCKLTVSSPICYAW